ncbi:protein GAMETE EXPRESSED 3 isoform X2 [Arachis hypogaea]|uniref:protein GAMETE EXPRESSED 3 isoform X2 n=1 Tax=Arachis hypogaea TaxID=3818 RepID=UPI003B20DFEE
MVKLENSGTSEPVAELFFGPGPGQQVETEIIGLSVSTLTSTVFINIKNRGLFAYKSHGRLLWSIGPVLYKFGYHQGCRKNITDCFFASVPVLDQCEGSIYISNTEGQLYCLSIRGRHFRWIQDFSYLDRNFTITAGNNGRLYVTVPVRALLLAVDVFSGNVLWQRSIGPLSKADSVPVVDSNGWVSIGSLDGFLYSFSPTGDLKKFSRRNTDNYVIQVGSFLDCSGFAVYTSQIEMEGKVSHTAGEFTTVSAIRPKVALLTMLVPATGSIYWSENNPETGNLLQCRTTGQKLASSCSQARTKLVSIYIGNERVIALFLLFESTVLAILIGLVRFCCSFWAKKKLQDQGLGGFLAKRCSLQLKKKALDRTITELERKAAEEAADREVLDKLVDMSKEREGIQRKLSTTYSLGRDKSDSHARSILPLQKGKTKSYSFQGTRGKNLTMFHTMSDTSSSESSYEGETSMLGNKDSSTKAKTKALMMEDSSSSSSS